MCVLLHGQASQAKTTIEALLREIDPALSLSDPNNTYLITGHSLGGVVANILAAKLTRAGCTAAGYTFAAPPPVALTEPTLYEYKYSIYNFANSGAGISGDLVPQVSQDAVLSELLIGGIGMGIGEALAKGALSRRYGTDFIFDSEATDRNGSAIRNMYKDLHGSNWNYSFDPLQRHSTSTYMAYLLTMEPSSYTFNREKRLIDIRCPVDVQVLNEKGEVVAEIVDNKIVFNNTDDVALLVADDEKIVQYDTAASYYLKLIGNDTGSMEIDVTDIATNEKEQKLSSSKGYVDIQLTDGKAFICDTEEVDAAKDVQLYLIDEDEKGTHIVETDGSETKLEEPIDFSKEPDEPDGPDGPDEPDEPDLPSVSDIFKDVSDSSWFKDAVQFVYDRGIIKGMTPDTFGPSVKLSRAQFAVMLYRMEKEPETEYTERFPDVAKGTWYTNAAMWASENKIITGYENGKFGPADQITREQMALMMYRYAKYKGYDVSVSEAFDAFKDAERVSGFAKEAMGWVVGMKIITGKQEGTALEPQGKASRAECATIIMRFMTAYVE